MDKVQILKELYNKAPDKTPFTWLNGRTTSEAFVICVGAGPWKFNRRKTIQGMALDKLNKRDLADIDYCDWYPLNWQNKFVNNLSLYLKNKNMSMYHFCERILHRHYLYDAVGCKHGTKVISLFGRDALKNNFNFFPIDRHVKRFLIKNNLPTNEDDMIDLCLLAGLIPKEVAVAFVKMASNMDNPDWSIK